MAGQDLPLREMIGGRLTGGAGLVRVFVITTATTTTLTGTITGRGRTGVG